MTKFTKILLPLGTVGAIASTVTPLVSCGNSTIDLLKYEATIKQLAKQETPLNSETAAKALFDQKNSTKIANQDILMHLKRNIANWDTMKYYLELLGYDTKYLGSEIKTAEAKLSNLKIEYQGKNKAKLSGNIELKMTVDMLSYEDTSKVVGTYTLSTKHEIKKMNYVVIKSETNKWNTNLDKELMTKDKEWSVKRTYEGYGVYTDKSNPSDYIESTYVYNIWSTGEWEKYLLKMICWDSYYLELNNEE